MYNENYSWDLSIINFCISSSRNLRDSAYDDLQALQERLQKADTSHAEVGPEAVAAVSECYQCFQLLRRVAAKTYLLRKAFVRRPLPSPRAHEPTVHAGLCQADAFSGDGAT